MNEKYNQPTAHMLQPVKGWDSMAHLDFVAPIAAGVDGALPGTVMHLNTAGQLETGLTAQGMGMYLFYKQFDEDIQPYPLTADGTQMTAVGMQSFGGYNSEMYLRHNWADNKADFYNTNGTASNVGPFNYGAQGATKSVAYTKGQAAHTTYPAICGMELSSTEFADKMGDGMTTIVYSPNDTLTAPLKAEFTASKPGTFEQQKLGGFLKKGACYVDPICGIVSKKPVINEHGYKQICFWSCWLPAAAENVGDIANSATLKVVNGSDPTVGGPAFKLMWDDTSSENTLWENAVVQRKLGTATTTISATDTATVAIPADSKPLEVTFKFFENATGNKLNFADDAFKVINGSDSASISTAVCTVNNDTYPAELNVTVPAASLTASKVIKVRLVSSKATADGAAIDTADLTAYTLS